MLGMSSRCSQVDGSQRYAISDALKPCRAEFLRPGMLPKYRFSPKSYGPSEPSIRNPPHACDVNVTKDPSHLGIPVPGHIRSDGASHVGPIQNTGYVPAYVPSN